MCRYHRRFTGLYTRGILVIYSTGKLQSFRRPQPVFRRLHLGWLVDGMDGGPRLPDRPVWGSIAAQCLRGRGCLCRLRLLSRMGWFWCISSECVLACRCKVLGFCPPRPPLLRPTRFEARTAMAIKLLKAAGLCGGGCGHWPITGHSVST